MNRVNPLLRRVLSSRLVRWPVYLFILFFIIGMFVPDDNASLLETAKHLHASTNPWRDLPADQETALKEVHFIAETLRDTFLPTSLPDEDDYEFLSKLLRTLETRNDISWTTLHETGVHRTVMAIANRYGAFAPEPFGLTDRFDGLHAHWSRLAREEAKPERWEVKHDTTFLPPLFKARSLDGGSAVDPGNGLTDLLSEVQRSSMEERYAEWRKDRDRKVSYLKLHPPSPMAWVPLPKKENGIRAAWDEVMEGGVVKAGKRVAERLLVASPKWKPMYRDLLTERVPLGWSLPGEVEMSREELDRWMERSSKDSERRQERRKKQEALVERLKAERHGTGGGKDEL